MAKTHKKNKFKLSKSKPRGDVLLAGRPKKVTKDCEKCTSEGQTLIATDIPITVVWSYKKSYYLLLYYLFFMTAFKSAPATNRMASRMAIVSFQVSFQA